MAGQDGERAEPARQPQHPADLPAEAPLNPVEEADEESFPASDPPPGPAHIGGPAAAPPDGEAGRQRQRPRTPHREGDRS